MKKVYSFLFVFLATLNSGLVAQIPNGNFENWQSSNIKLNREQREVLIIGDYIPNESNTGLLPGWTPNYLEQVIPSTPTSKYIYLNPGLYENKIFSTIHCL